MFTARSSKTASGNKTTQSSPMPTQDPSQQPEPGDNDQIDDHQATGFWALLDRFAFRIGMPSFLISLIVHLVITFLAGIILIGGGSVPIINLEASNTTAPTESVDLDSLDVEENNETEMESEDLSQDLAETIENAEELEQVDPTEATEVNPDVVDPALLSENGIQAAETSAAAMSGLVGLESRRGANRRQAALANGGTEESEDAVEMGLKWLAAHQNRDGGWDLDHQVDPSRPRTRRVSPNPGIPGIRIGATGLAILPYLGAGYTHKDGKYKKVVERGLRYMIQASRNMGEKGIAFYEPGLDPASPNMYSHAIATICFCEAYTLTKDKRLLPICQGAVRHILFFQDPQRGGWKYFPQQGSDTSVTGWVVIALKSAKLAGIEIPEATFKKTNRFLNFVQGDGGESYGYESSAQTKSMTLRSVGILCRMYLGWKKNHPPLVGGVKRIDERGPDLRYNPPNSNKASANVYYNYYGTMVMRNYGGAEWRNWNPKMRDFLVRVQSKKGATKGSWYYRNDSQSASSYGGRLYVTSLSILTLEVYYRYLPIFKQDNFDDFPL